MIRIPEGILDQQKPFTPVMGSAAPGLFVFPASAGRPVAVCPRPSDAPERLNQNMIQRNGVQQSQPPCQLPVIRAVPSLD